MQRYYNVNVGGVNIPFNFSIGVLKRYARSNDLSLSVLLEKIGSGDLETTTNIYYEGVCTGYKLKGVPNPFKSIEDFEDFIGFSDIEAISNLLEQSMPVQETEKKTPKKVKKRVENSVLTN